MLQTCHLLRQELASRERSTLPCLAIERPTRIRPVRIRWSEEGETGQCSRPLGTRNRRTALGGRLSIPRQLDLRQLSYSIIKVGHRGFLGGVSGSGLCSDLDSPTRRAHDL